MATNSKIEWCDATWNPVRGCSRVSEGCRNCYAERMAARGLPGMKDPTTGEPFAVMAPQGPRWTGRVELIESMLNWPLKRRKPLRIFVNSMSDLFHEGLRDDQIGRVFEMMCCAPQHAFLVLTKRTERMRQFMTLYTRPGGPLAPGTVWCCRHIHLGVSVENRAALHRIDHLRETPAAVRFLSCEPLLEDLGELDLRGIHQVIVGGESGPGARPMHPDWARSIRDQCVAAGVAFFFKQWGEWAPFATTAHYAKDSLMPGNAEIVGGDCGGPSSLSFFEHGRRRIPNGKCVAWWSGEMSGGKGTLAEIRTVNEHRWGRENLQTMTYVRVGKARAGRLLDGREWNEMPEAQL